MHDILGCSDVTLYVQQQLWLYGYLNQHVFTTFSSVWLMLTLCSSSKNVLVVSWIGFSLVCYLPGLKGHPELFCQLSGIPLHIWVYLSLVMSPC